MGRLEASKNDVEHEADLKDENERSRKPQRNYFWVVLGAKIGPRRLQDAFEAALVLHHIFDVFFESIFG